MKTALGIIDVQRGFMPAEEGERLGGLPGFGELPVPGGDSVVPALNKLLLSDVHVDFIFTTQDWHPEQTAHFAEEPNYTDTWPIHCVALSPGSKIHPELAAQRAFTFTKGSEELTSGKDDTSYSGYNSISHMTSALNAIGEEVPYIQPLPEILVIKGVRRLILGGLATDYCVKTTAIDFASKTDIEVVVLSDAIKPVAEETGRLAIREMIDAGVRFATVDEVIEELSQYVPKSIAIKANPSPITPVVKLGNFSLKG